MRVLEGAGFIRIVEVAGFNKKQTRNRALRAVAGHFSRGGIRFRGCCRVSKAGQVAWGESVKKLHVLHVYCELSETRLVLRRGSQCKEEYQIASCCTSLSLAAFWLVYRVLSGCFR